MHSNNHGLGLGLRLRLKLTVGATIGAFIER
jgi:hypothetical protein